MKTLLITFAIMYIIGEIVNLAGYWTYNHFSRERLDKVRGAMTLNVLGVNARYINHKDYIKTT